MKCQDCTGDNGPVNTVLKDAFAFPSIKKVGRQEKGKETDDLCWMIILMLHSRIFFHQKTSSSFVRSQLI